MTLKHCGFILFFIFYLVLFLLFLESKHQWFEYVGCGLSIYFLLLTLWMIRDFESIYFRSKLMKWGLIFYSIFLTASGILTLYSMISTHMPMLLNGFALIAVAVDFLFSRKRIHSFVKIAVASIFFIGAILSVPIPSTQTLAVSLPVEFEIPGKQGKILAPNVMERKANLMEVIYKIKSEKNARENTKLVNNLPLGEKIFKEFFDELFLIPEDFYTVSDTDTSVPHQLMKTLAKWNEHQSEDVTQGKTVMGIGEVTSDGNIIMVENIEALTTAALKSNPDVLIVPYDAFSVVKDIAPNLIVVPVSHFVEVLYFLSQPVKFWPVSYALFCH